MFSVTSAIAQDSFDNISNAREQALKTGGIDKTPFQKRFAELDKEVRYSEIYNQSVTPDQPDFPQKFKSFIMRIDKYNKKNGYNNSFNVKDILDSNNIYQNSSIPMGGGNGDGKNGLDPDYLLTGDIVLVNNPGVHIQGPIQHAGMMDKRLYKDYNSGCYISAQPKLGVIYETTNDYRNKYDEAFVCEVNYLTDYQAIAAVDRVTPYLGKPYYWYAPKTSTDKWYCSKVPWYGYYYGTKKDIDADGGYWCLPVDILNDNDVSLLFYFS